MNLYDFAVLLVVFGSSVFCSSQVLYPEPPSSTSGPGGDSLLNAATTKGCKDEFRVYDSVTRKCWRLGGTGPCGDLMVFERDYCGSYLGTCNCVSPRSPCLPPLAPSDPPSRKCFEYFTQGPCKPDEWLVPTFNSTFGIGEAVPACQPNVCLYQTLSADEDDLGNRTFWPPKFFFAFNGKCFVAGTQAFCGPDQVALFVGGLAVPGCYPKDGGNYGLCAGSSAAGGGAGSFGFSSGEPASCPEGYEEDSAGDCSLVSK